jgi:hypothetical protein
MPRGSRHLVALAVMVLAALAVCGSAQPMSGCAGRLLSDWRDGRINQVYPVDCYRRALTSLPEDLRIYSSAESDITRALQNRVRAEPEAMAAAKNRTGHRVPPYLVVVITVGLAIGAASVVALTR